MYASWFDVWICGVVNSKMHGGVLVILNFNVGNYGVIFIINFFLVKMNWYYV